jgi:hypothetical protein
MPENIEQQNIEVEPVVPEKKSFFKRFWWIGIVIIVLIVGGYFVYAKTSIFYKTVTKVVFEEENVSGESFNDLLLKTEQLAKKWAPDAELKWMRFSIPEGDYFASYEIMYVSQSKKVQTDAGLKPAILDIRYNCQPHLVVNKLMRLKGHGCKPMSNNKLVAIFCDGGETCDQTPAYSLPLNIINRVKVSGMDAFEKTPGKSKMGLLVVEDSKLLWRMGWGYNVDAETGEVSMKEEKKDYGLDSDNDELDSDNDGLTDSEEKEYGTDPNNPDTDSDGYTDSEEIDNGYDPLVSEKDYEKSNEGTGRQVISGWKVYTSEHCNCSFNYPVSWKIDDQLKEGRGWISVYADEYYEQTNVTVKRFTINNYTNSYDGSIDDFKQRIIEHDERLYTDGEKYTVSDYEDNKYVEIIQNDIDYSGDIGTTRHLLLNSLDGRTMLLSKFGKDATWQDEEIKKIISSIRLISN